MFRTLAAATLLLSLSSALACSSGAPAAADTKPIVLGGAEDGAAPAAREDSGAPSSGDDAGSPATGDDAGGDSAVAVVVDSGTTGDASDAAAATDAGTAPVVDAGPSIVYCQSSFSLWPVATQPSPIPPFTSAYWTTACMNADGHGTSGAPSRGTPTITCASPANCAGYPGGPVAGGPFCNTTPANSSGLMPGSGDVSVCAW